jgi:hypothetical protein
MILNMNSSCLQIWICTYMYVHNNIEYITVLIAHVLRSAVVEHIRASLIGGKG